MRQGIQLRFPESAVRFDPRGSALHRLSGQAAAVDAAVDFALEQASGFEDAEVFGNGGEGNVKGSG